MTEFLTVKEVSEIVRRGIHTIHNWIDSGKIPVTILPSGTKLIPKAKFESWLKQHTHDPDSKRL